MDPITVETIVRAPVGKAWRCFTDPAHITKWNAASDDWHTPRATNDLRVGGKLTSRMEAKDGSMGFDFEGIYDEVVPNKRLAFHMPDGRKVVVTFTPEGDGTRVAETFDPEGTHPLEMQRGGWQAILDNYKKHTEAS